MTYREALEKGYKNGDIKMYRGYVSRKIDVYSQPVKVAEGFRKGEFYVELPNFNSSYYGKLRQYLIPPKDNK